MENIPSYLNLIFILTTLLTVALLYYAAHQSKTTLYILCGWLILQGIIAMTGFYTVTNVLPPRFALLPGPPIVAIVLLFLLPKGRLFLDSLNTQTLTLLHCVRIPVEFCLYSLFMYKTIPQLMTFEGRNFDILSGLSAPFIYYFGYVKPVINKKVLLLWNFICLGLLINIVVNAALSAPFPFQQQAFDQPNIAVLYFPFNYLPACIVPLVLLSHLATIRQLLGQSR